jgi:hypothetical protein
MPLGRFHIENNSYCCCLRCREHKQWMEEWLRLNERNWQAWMEQGVIFRPIVEALIDAFSDWGMAFCTTVREAADRLAEAFQD